MGKEMIDFRCFDGDVGECDPEEPLSHYPEQPMRDDGESCPSS